MAAVCEVCGKHPSFGMRISHSHIRTKRRWNPNIQRIRALVNGTPKRMHVCTSCIKAGKVQKARSLAAASRAALARMAGRAPALGTWSTPRFPDPRRPHRCKA